MKFSIQDYKKTGAVIGLVKDELGDVNILLNGVIVAYFSEDKSNFRIDEGRLATSDIPVDVFDE